MVNGKRKFCKHFKAVADREELLSCYLCSMPQDGLRAGMLYLSASWICFYSKMLSKKIKVVINIPKITSITQEKTARIIPNAIRVTTDTESYVFASFVSRNNVYKKLMKLWKDTETEASDSGASDLDALQQMSPEDVQLESGTVNFLLSDSEDVSSEGSMPLTIDCADGSRLIQRKAPASPSPASSGWRHSESSALPRITAVDHSSVPEATTCNADTGNTAEPSIEQEQVSLESERVAASLQQHSSGTGRSRARLFHWIVPINVAGVAVHLASVSRQSIMLIITVVLCLTSTMTMYRLSMLESSAATSPSQLTPGQWQHNLDTASLLASNRRSDKMIATILDSNLQMLQEIKDSLALLKTLLDRRQQPETEATPGPASKNQEQPEMTAALPTAEHH